MKLGDVPVYESPFAPTHFDDGRPRLFQYVGPRLGGPYVLVHPTRMDAFVMAVNQPDVFAHPEVRELLLGKNGENAPSAGNREVS